KYVYINISIYMSSCVSVDMLSDEPNPGARPLKRDSEQKILSATLRLNNHFLSDLTRLMDTLSALYASAITEIPENLLLTKQHHSLSFRQVLTQLKELRLLYLHGNRICKLSEVDKLAALPFLHTITLHGNPIVTEREYRTHLIGTLPHVKMIDFSAVTKQERELTSVWQRSRNPRKSTGHSKVD
uniref:Leucine-rich repeat-containing protein 51 n=1 Tax=Cyprinus carpio TaxID=7962 RepID=A0A8C2AC08_CYPCA